MTTDIQAAASQPRFSWKRVLDVAGFFRGQITRQLTVYLITSFIFSVLLVLPVKELSQFGLFTLIWTVLPYLFYFGPLVFAKFGDTRIFERMLPVTAAERYVFYLLYLLVIVPIAVFLLPVIAQIIYMNVPAIQTDSVKDLYELRQLWLGTPSSIINTVGGVAMVATCLFAVLHARTGRIIKGVLGVFAVQIAIGISGAFWGFSAAFQAGIIDGRQGAEPSPQNITSALIDQMMQFSAIYITIIALLTGYTIYMLVLDYRAIRTRNL